MENIRHPRRLVVIILLIGLLAACLPSPTPIPPVNGSITDGTQSVSLPPSYTPSPTITRTATPGPSPTATNTATPGPSPTATHTPSSTATLPGNPTADISTQSPFATPATAIPTAVAPVQFQGEVVNVLLLGRDTSLDIRSYRTDVIIIVSVNRTTNTVTMLSIPRDLYVYIPGWTMNRINTAANHGDAISYPGGGPALLAQTILYNLGIPIHYYAMIDFDGFKNAVNTFGGVDVPVTCAMQDWRLKSPELDVNNPDNWEQYYLETGVHRMDGDLALWYSRSRRATNDFDRSRRQQRVLRAVLSKALSTDSLTRIPALYQQYSTFVRTDVTVDDALTFVPIAANLQNFDIKSRFIGPGQVLGWRTPEGASVLLPDPVGMSALLAEAFLPPRSAALRESLPTVQVVDASGIADMGLLAADNLEWEGFSAALSTEGWPVQPTTVIYDYTTSDKGSYIRDLQDLFNLSDAAIISQPTANAPYPYRVILGADYNPCTYGLSFPAPAPTATPGGPAIGDGNTLYAIRLTQPLLIDGEISDWNRDDFRGTIDQPVFGPENYTGLADASASWASAWDDQYLYFAFIVRDNVVSQPTGQANMLQGDSIELLLNMDLFGDINTDSLNGDDYQWGFSPGDLPRPPAPHTAYLWYPIERQGPQDQVILSFKLTPDGYQGEIALPWALLQHSPAEGQAFGFVLSLMDNDTPGQPGLQSIVSSSRQRDLEHPNTWAERLALASPRN